MVHRRVVDGSEIVLGNQGALYKSAMTWWDHDTGSVWSQPLGKAILGPRKGERLKLLPSALTDWATWKEQHPNTHALDFEAGSAGYSLESLIIAVELEDDAVGYPVAEVRDEGGLINDTIAGVPVAVYVDRHAGQWTVFSRRLDDRDVTLGIRNGRLVDDATGTVWDPVRGHALEGPLKGETLDQLPAFTAFPANFDDFFPEGRIWFAGATG